MVKNPSASAEDIRDVGSIPGLGRSLKEDMATHSSILAWKSHSLAGYRPWGSQELGKTEVT